jgi:hypothetical protein
MIGDEFSVLSFHGFSEERFKTFWCLGWILPPLSKHCNAECVFFGDYEKLGKREGTVRRIMGRNATKDKRVFCQGWKYCGCREEGSNELQFHVMSLE